MTDWNRRPEVIDAEERYGDHSEWERSLDERDAAALAESWAEYESRVCVHCGGPLTTGPTGFVDCEACNPSPWRDRW